MDVAELCDGVSGVPKACVKRRVKTGRNSDIAVGVNLLNPQHADNDWQRLTVAKLSVVAMTLPCIVFDAWSYTNKFMQCTPDVPLSESADHWLLSL